MYLIDLDKVPTRKLYEFDEAGNRHAAEFVSVEDIKAAPVVSPESMIPHGFWVVVHDVDGNFKCCSCSECSEDDDRLTKYCPSCGARMDKRISR